MAGAICLNWWGTEFWPGRQDRYPYRLLWQRVSSSEKVTTPGLRLLHLIDNLDQRFAWVGNQIERLARALQIAKIRRHPLHSLPGGAVRYSDRELGFHPPKTLM